MKAKKKQQHTHTSNEWQKKNHTVLFAQAKRDKSTM